MDPTGALGDDVRAKVLRSTLDEISSCQGADPESQDLCCVICLDNISEPCAAYPCEHQNFDFLCLVSWLQERPTCPLCKSEIKELRYDYGDDGKEWKTFRVPAPAKPDIKLAYVTAPVSEYQRRPPRSRSRQRHRSQRPVTLDEALSHRRHIYRNQLYSLHVGANRHSQPTYQELTPQLFEARPDLVSKARMWIRRELQVFEFLTPSQSNDAMVARRRASNAEFLLEYVIAILKTVDLQGSCGQAEEMLQEFLGRDNARLFLHELRSWLRSPYGSLQAWDNNVQYPETRQRSTRVPTNDPVSDQKQSGGRGGSHWRPREGRYSPYRREHHNSAAQRRRAATRGYLPD